MTAPSEILEVVDEFSAASVGLVAWELMIDEHVIRGQWDRAVEAGLLQHVGVDRYGEDVYEIAPIGRAELTAVTRALPG